MIYGLLCFKWTAKMKLASLGLFRGLLPPNFFFEIMEIHELKSSRSAKYQIKLHSLLHYKWRYWVHITCILVAWHPGILCIAHFFGILERKRGETEGLYYYYFFFHSSHKISGVGLYFFTYNPSISMTRSLKRPKQLYYANFFSMVRM